ncbi:hypothetical protein QLQ12_08435 [Actinoplanes sp. NEAU-A12]|uniref:Uncharacterized protein n=1 Tax=Actinoplanes sandaracinus TaxID=3045177 RepID=A0ABT6WFY6_9ACTN|nr:hypothetical protein [Actinoplanes sandaracinus]MDI6098627.1 hypothetical protein [Actinoplanes sandaracinus]
MDIFEDDETTEPAPDRGLWRYVATQSSMLLLAGAVAVGVIVMVAVVLLSLYVGVMD